MNFYKTETDSQKKQKQQKKYGYQRGKRGSRDKLGVWD